MVAMKQKMLLLLLLLLTTSIAMVSGSNMEYEEKDDNSKEQSIVGENRKPKLFSVFQVVTFQNGACAGNSNNNGTCYTLAECTAKGGTSSGATCASGYGICCIFTLSCGGTTSQNCTYLVQASINKATTTDPCTYTICKCSSNICRIRLDFTTFNIAGPVTGSTTTTLATSTSTGGAIGDCTTDTFSLNSPGKSGSPVICGYNTGQHMIVDASDTCSTANFNLGSTSDTRQWNIKVTQYACGDSNGGPSGCLQYFTGSTGRISSYNFPTSSSTVGATATHLSNQCYMICIRQETGKCSICYTTSITGTVPSGTNADAAIAQSSFGLSNPTMAIAVSATGTLCSTDYLAIPNAEVNFAAGVMAGMNRICGRVFYAGQSNNQVGFSVCSATKPFQMQFKTDGNENTAIAVAAGAVIASASELSGAPGGIVGFSLNYVEQSC